MKDQVFISDLMDQVAVKIAKKKVMSLDLPFKKENSYDKMMNSIPEFNEVYKDILVEHNRIAVHSELGVFPYEILRSKAPNQTDDEWKYQLGLYESYTNSDWNRAKSKTKIVANPQNYSITGWNEEQKKYFKEDYPVYHSLLSYFWDVVRDQKLDYPNKVLLVEPLEIPGAYVEDEEGVTYFKPDQSQEISPVAKIIDEEDVVQFKENDYCLLIYSDDIPYQMGNRTRNDGLGFRFYDKETIWEINQVGWSKGLPVFEDPRLVYTHAWGYLPAQKLKGKIVDECDGNILYSSPFVDAVPSLNSVIRLSSNRDMSNYKMAFPVIIALVDDCDYSDSNGLPCKNGNILTDNGYKQCPSCKGTGTKSNHSPTGVYEVRATKGYGEQNTLAMTPPVQFAAPDISILEYLSKQIEENRKKAFSFIFETDDAKSNTATGVALEKEEFHSFMLQFSNELFDLLEFAIEAIGWYRYGSSFEMPSITRPIAFNFRSNKAITSEITEAKAAGLPSTYQVGLIDESNETRFNNNDKQKRRTELAARIDRLFYMDNPTIGALIGQRRANQLAVVLHDSINTYITNAEFENENFWELDYEAQKTIIMGYAEADVLAMQPEAKSNNIIPDAGIIV